MNRELKLAYDILCKVCIEKSYVSIELNKSINKSEGINTALVTKIVYGVLEKDISLDYFIVKFISKKPNDKVLILLKIVAFVSQEINSIPNFALVSEIVNISKAVDKHVSGFVNAVSKKLVSNKPTLPSEKDYVKYLSIKYNFPEWVIKELLKEHDKVFVESLIAHELSTLTHVRVNLDKVTPKDFKLKLNDNGIKYEDSLYDYTLYIDYAKALKTGLSELFIVQGLPSIITCNVLGADG